MATMLRRVRIGFLMCVLLFPTAGSWNARSEGLLLLGSVEKMDSGGEDGETKG